MLGIICMPRCSRGDRAKVKPAQRRGPLLLSGEGQEDGPEELPSTLSEDWETTNGPGQAWEEGSELGGAPLGRRKSRCTATAARRRSTGRPREQVSLYTEVHTLKSRFTHSSCGAHTTEGKGFSMGATALPLVDS